MHLLIHEQAFRPAHPVLMQTDYTGYAIPKRARADESLVRMLAAQIIGRAHTQFGGRIRDWRQQNLDPTVVSQQRADIHHVSTFHHLLQLQDRFLVTEAEIRTMTTTVDPMIWHQINSNTERRQAMAELDHQLLDAVHALQHAAQTMDFSMLRHETKNTEQLCTGPMMTIGTVIAKRAAIFVPVRNSMRVA